MIDITKHNWSWCDHDIPDSEPDVIVNKDNIELVCDYDKTIAINKDDAIAIARHFGLIKDNQSVFCSNCLWGASSCPQCKKEVLACSTYTDTPGCANE